MCHFSTLHGRVNFRCAVNSASERSSGRRSARGTVASTGIPHSLSHRRQGGGNFGSRMPTKQPRQKRVGAPAYSPSNRYVLLAGVKYVYVHSKNGTDLVPRAEDRTRQRPLEDSGRRIPLTRVHRQWYENEIPSAISVPEHCILFFFGAVDSSEGCGC
jgi:hypothetical protein